MRQAMKHRFLHVRIWFATAAILVVAIFASGQESKSSWTAEKSAIRGVDISARSEISSPQGSGFATLKIKCQPGVTPPAIVYLSIESPEKLPSFPFDKYDGPVNKTDNEFIRFTITSVGQDRLQTLKVKVPNGGYDDGVFVFDTIEKSVVSFLSKVKDGQKLTVTVNGPPSSIQVVFNTTGLKKLLDNAGVEAVTGSAESSHSGPKN